MPAVVILIFLKFCEPGVCFLDVSHLRLRLKCTSAFHMTLQPDSSESHKILFTLPLYGSKNNDAIRLIVNFMSKFVPFEMLFWNDKTKIVFYQTPASKKMKIYLNFHDLIYQKLWNIYLNWTDRSFHFRFYFLCIYAVQFSFST